jgi:outer membrane lipoprotein SlyB
MNGVATGLEKDGIVNVLTRTPSSTTKRTAASFSLATLMPPMQTGAGATRVHRGVWVAVGLMALTIVALATALVVKSGDSSPAATTAAPVAQLTTPAPMNAPDATAATPPVKSAAAATNHAQATDAAANPGASQQVVSAPICPNCGVVDSYNAVKVQGQTNGVGAVAGGVGGAVIGSKVAGRGNHTLGGVIGAIGGGLLGNAVEKHVRTYTMYDVHVRMDDGTVRTVRQSAAPAIGAHVTVDGHSLHAAPATSTQTSTNPGT